MKINTIKIKNFRGIPDMEISLERISFFTGPCGAGKTSVLKPVVLMMHGPNSLIMSSVIWMDCKLFLVISMIRI